MWMQKSIRQSQVKNPEAPVSLVAGGWESILVVCYDTLTLLAHPSPAPPTVLSEAGFQIRWTFDLTRYGHSESMALLSQKIYGTCEGGKKHYF